MSREEILNRVNVALRDTTRQPLTPNARMTPRTLGDVNAEIDLFIAEIQKLGGIARRVANRDELQMAMRELVEKENIRKATVWETDEMHELGIEEMLGAFDVQTIPQSAPAREVAQCDLGITGVDAALPEVGSIVLRTSEKQSRLVSLLPRVHLAVLRPAVLRGDLHDVFTEIKNDRRTVFITGPSRTTDIEKVLTIGVHGPKSLYVWVCNAVE